MNDIGIVRVRNLTQSDSGRGVARNLPKEAPLFIFVSKNMMDYQPQKGKEAANFFFPCQKILNFSASRIHSDHFRYDQKHF